MRCPVCGSSNDARQHWSMVSAPHKRNRKARYFLVFGSFVVAIVMCVNSINSPFFSLVDCYHAFRATQMPVAKFQSVANTMSMEKIRVSVIERGTKT